MADMKTVGPYDFPKASEFEGANSSPGDPFGDKSSRPNPSSGGSLADGLAMRMSIAGVTEESLGMCRNVSNGKPDGPAKGSVNNSGGSAKLRWG